MFTTFTVCLQKKMFFKNMVLVVEEEEEAVIKQQHFHVKGGKTAAYTLTLH